MNRTKAERLIGFVMGTDLNGNEEDVMEVEGECVENISLCSMERLPRLADTYCFTEPETGRGLFNGICTGQCTEIIEYSDDKEYAVCNLASIALPRFILPNPRRRLLEQKKMVVYSKKDCPFCCLLELETQDMDYEKRDILEYATEWEETRRIHALTTVPAIFLEDQYLGGFTEVWKSHLSPVFDFKELQRVVGAVVQNLNRIIDLNVYPLPETEVSNKKHRPIGVGVQGLADVFMLLGHPFLSEESKEVNRNIFETIYHGALEASCELAERYGPYETFSGSPASKGILQFDMWGVSPMRYDWDALKTRIRTHGIRNSLLLAPMPTASTSQILGFNECIEPITSNIYSRRTLAGEFIQANKYMMHDLIQLGLWNEKIKNNIIANHGSLQHIDVIPQEVKDKYRTVWEIPMRHLIDMAAERGAFVCQSQSLNLWLEDPTYNTLTSMHFYSWQKGLKTGIYYLRRRGKHQAQQFTIEPEKAALENPEENEICEMCSS
jgi:ribonucleoside-diphosphate reductase alpha subunit